MSADSGEGNKIPGFVRLGEDNQGREVLAMPYSEKLASEAVGNGLAEKTQTQPEPEDNEGETPEPGSSEADEYRRGAGPIMRFNDVFTDLGSVQLEAMGLDGQEIANASATLRNEMYRSNFPSVQPRFAAKCVDGDCKAEYSRDLEFCLECAREAMKEQGVENPPTDPGEVPEEFRDYPVRPPSPTEKREAERLAESINKEGQSLRELMKVEEDDQSRMGVSTVVAKKDYAVAEGDTMVYDRGEMIHEGVDELVRGDPKRIVPVVDENGRVGGHWWTCPIHRDDARVGRKEYEEEGVRRCGECGAELREVFFAETGGAGRFSRTDSPEKLFFQDEIVTWARYYPRLHGLDGLSPIHHIWLKQAILHWMDIYGAAFYDPDSERYPNKFMVVHTTNPKAWEKQLDKAEEDAKENPYSEQIMFNEYSGESNTTPEVQVVDLMSDDLLGQDQQIRDQYKQDIRTHFGVTNVFDSELSDAGGLNNEGLQMEVTDRTIASAMHDTVAGPLDEIAKRLGIDDWIFEFVPPQDTDIEELRNHIEVGEKAVGAGLDATLEDDEVEVHDGDFEEGEDEEGEGGLGALFGGDFEDLNDRVAEKAVGDDGWSADTRTFRVVPAEDEEDNYEDGVLGVGVDFPESGVYIDWHLEAFPDSLDEPHVSEYGSLADLKKATNNDVVDYGPPAGERADGKAGDADDAPEDADWRADGTERTPAESADDGEPERKRRAKGGEEGNEDGGLSEKEERLEDVRKLDEAFEHIVWADETTKAEPFWDDSEAVPDFVAEVISDVVPDVIRTDLDSLPGAIGARLIDVFEDNMTQPQGWSLASISRDISSEFGVPLDDAELVARTETASVLNEAREEGYERAGALDDPDRLFRWKGPQDHRTTDACEWLKKKTEGGVTYDRLIELEKEATEKFLPHLDFRKHCIHPNERHTWSETYKLDHPGADDLVVEHKLDLSPAISGTFVAA